MRIALGLKVHSGWAALVALGARDGEVQVVDRRRIELVEEADARWAKQPYHAADGLPLGEARTIVQRGIKAARRLAEREMRAAVKRAREAEYDTVACALLVTEAMPDWSIEEILAVHFRMHKAEGVLFREALARAADACGLKLVAIPEKLLSEEAERVLATSARVLKTRTTELGKSAGPPWGRDQKDAALAAMIALQGTAKGRSLGSRSLGSSPVLGFGELEE
jgi:hypothetical protein